MTGEEEATRPASGERRRFGRRGLLAGGLGALIGGLVARVSPAKAAPGEPLILGQENFSDLPTTLTMQGKEGAALRVDGTQGIQVITEVSPLEAHAPGGAAVWGTSMVDPGAPPSFPTGVLGQGVPGVAGLSPAVSEAGLSVVQEFGPGAVGYGDRFGLWGHGAPSQVTLSLSPDFHSGGVGISDRIGMVGFGGPSEVMFSLAPDFRAGVAGAGDTGVWGAVVPPDHRIGSPPPHRAAILGTAPPGATAVVAENPGGMALKAVGDSEFLGDVSATAVVAENPGDLALKAVGRSEFLGDVSFMTSGTGVVPAGQKSVTINDPNVRPGSQVHVTLTGSPGTNRSFLHYVQVLNGALRVVLKAAPTQNTPFNYLVYQRPG